MIYSNLSIEEKIELVKGSGNWHTSNLNGKIKAIHLSDGPHGLRAQEEDAKSNNDSITATLFPTACASACSFNPDLIGEMAAAIAREAKEAGVSVLLGPGVNMKRSPLCGRNFEYFSEDPYLAGELATAYVKGVQDKNIGTSLKHFAGNSQEFHRMTSNSMIDERALREIYLRAFEKVVKDAKPATIMASYNLLNGLPACENKWLLRNVLREEWGFQGLVMSDWGACVDAGACIEAGMDLEMPDSRGNHREEILARVKNGSLSEKALDDAAVRVQELAEQYKSKHEDGLRSIPEEMLDSHTDLAVRVATQSAVLMKNDGILPLKNPQKVIVIGDLAANMRMQGGGSSHIKTRKMPNILDVLNDEGIKVSYYRGYDSNSKNIGEITSQEQKEVDNTVIELNNELNDNKDTPVIIVGGLTDNAEGEGFDRVSYSLPMNQVKLYEAISRITDNVIYVSFGGSPYDMGCISYARACLNMYLGGEGVAMACVNLLLGKDNPSGRLAETWPRRIEDTPCYSYFGSRNNKPDDVPYCESLFIGYRFYDSYKVPVAYPFGFGLSYTEFEYSNLRLSQNEDRYHVTVNVKNTGNMAGFETVLLFVKNPHNGIIRANREFRGFSKVFLEPNENTDVKIFLDDRTFDIYDCRKQAYIRVGGEYEIEISKNVADVILSQTIMIDGEMPENQRDRFTSYFYNEGDITRRINDGVNDVSRIPDVKDTVGLSGENKRPADSETVGMKREGNIYFSIEDFRELYGKPLSDFSNVAPGGFSAKNSLKQMAPYSMRARILLRIGKIASTKITGKPLDDPETRMMYEGISEGNIDSVCNQSGGIITKKMINRIIASANKGRK